MEQSSLDSAPTWPIVLEIVRKALVAEDERAHEFVWIAPVHECVLDAGLRTSCREGIKITDLYESLTFTPAFS